LITAENHESSAEDGLNHSVSENSGSNGGKKMPKVNGRESSMKKPRQRRGSFTKLSFNINNL
jgi:hypothetical protein